MWQRVKLSVQIRPLDTLACCWDVKQPTNKQKTPYAQKLEIIVKQSNDLSFVDIIVIIVAIIVVTIIMMMMVMVICWLCCWWL